MILKMYVFFDRVSQQYMPQFFMMPNHEVCLRGMKKLVNNPQFPHRDIVEDLQLYCLGDFNAETAQIDYSKEFVANLIDFKEVEK